MLNQIVNHKVKHFKCVNFIYKRNQTGFTLIELMVVVAIVGILAAVAVPSFSQQVKLNRLVSNANQLQSVFKFARSEAAKRNETITLVANGNNWDVTLNNGTILQQFIPTSNNVTVTGLADVIILATGEVSAVGFAPVNFTITDNDNDTLDYAFTALASGQTTLIPTAPVSVSANSHDTLTGG